SPPTRFLTLCGALIIAAFLLPPGPAQAAPAQTPPPNDPQISYSLTPVLSGLSQPLYVTHAGDDRLFIVEQTGAIKIVRNGAILPSPFLNVSSKILVSSEQGLLGLAFEPNYAATGRFYIYYTALNSDVTIARYTVSANPDVADANSGVVLLAIPHPTYANHNGGWLAFGPDRLLYAGTGDGGSAGNPFCAAQNVTDLRGKLLRLNVVGQVTYTIPASNIFTTTQKGEVYAIGLRNPWRNSFDRLTGELYIGDVGQDLWEEIDVQPAGHAAGVNYGWSQYEGTHFYSLSCTPSSIAPQMPVAEYGHAGVNCAIVGGYVYRGPSYWWLYGDYFYADLCSGSVWAMWQPSPGVYTSTLVLSVAGIHSFGEDKDGELYAVGNGTLYRLTSATTIPPIHVSNVAISGPASGVAALPYTFRAQAAPLTASLPITYVWQATGQATVTHTVGLTDTITFTWNSTGTQAITVTASNGSAVQDTHSIDLSEPQRLYLPLMMHE
ncbi:MAG TPA: PQQ-dependent sugar dehydrogenase, partial [Anaerolineae bacterium]